MNRLATVNVRLFLLLVTSWVSAWGSRWNLPKSPRHVTTQELSESGLPIVYEPTYHYCSEVVGASGRVGSFWLCHGDDPVPVPRGVSPGCLSAIGSPIYVATPSSAWQQIWTQTIETRRQDVVFVGNGLPLPEWQSATVVVPHFAILTKCQINQSSLSTNSQSPPTYLNGRHASETARILQAHGVTTKILESFQDIQKAAAFKVLWASSMWLMCHSSDSPLTVAQVHNNKQDELDQLVDELYPALVQLVAQSVDRDELDRYLREYSFSIPDAIPSRELAMAELNDRNGVFLSRRSDEHPQAYHQQLIQNLVGTILLNNILQQLPPERCIQKEVKADSIGLVCWGEKGPFQPASTSVMIIGAGIMGSSLALSLAERRPNLRSTVLDQLPHHSSVGKTTPASWAWLNANAKYPKSYQLLNQLGIHAWKNEPHLHGLVSWMGSLVRFEDPPQFVMDGGYPAEGPLSHQRIQELEPLANWILDDTDSKQEGFTYFFRDEGCVDPMVAVQTLQQAAQEKGVQFLRHVNVTSVIRDPRRSGRICGITAWSQDQQEQITLSADVVVVAAGAGSGTKALGCGFQLLRRPGAIAFTKPKQPEDNRRLSRILVDPLRSSHVLQRPDGSIVVGGGALEVGGTIGTVRTTTSSTGGDNPPVQSSLLDGAKRLVPTILDGSVVTQTCEAVRPMPTDGLPIVGFIEDGLYALVSHSGMTLGPLLSSLAAAEIADGVSCELLSSYRPLRFSKPLSL